MVSLNKPSEMETSQVEVVENTSLENILFKIEERRPVLIRGWDIGPCVDTWTCERLAKRVGDLPIKIHVSQDGKMDFIKKNFLYKTLGFDEMIKRVFRSHQMQYFINNSEYYYYRSLGEDRRGKQVANFFEQFYDLARDLKMPPFFNLNDYFSSVLRASSKGLQMWTHYDIMDNVLIQVVGSKRAVLWPPSEVDKLYLIRDKSEVINIDEPDVEKYPKFLKAQRFECVMNPGDILFIPALWFHNTTTLKPSLGVNIFWKNLHHDLYDKNDTYGNKDLVIGAKGLRAVQSSIKALDTLPTEYKHFYVQRMIQYLEKSLTE